MAFFRFRTPDYLQLTATGVYTFRFRIPAEFQHCIDRREFKYSLKTRSLREARLKVFGILEFLEESFQKIRAGVLSGYTVQKLTEYLKEGIHKARFCMLPNGTSTYVPTFAEDSINHEMVQNEPVPEMPPVEERPQTTFEDIESNFLKEKKLSKEWRYKTEEDHIAVFNLFKEIHGKSLPVSSIDKALMRDFKSTIMCLPPNMRKLKA